jgi:DNA replication and repair protein RecF
MRLDRLELYGFRNYEELKAAFVPGVNLIVGENAQGKTNLLEAITYLSTAAAASVRGRKRSSSVSARRRASFSRRSFRRSVCRRMRAVLFAGRKPRQLYLSGVKKRSGRANCPVCFHDGAVLSGRSFDLKKRRSGTAALSGRSAMPAPAEL